jgi:hypothetical protein
MMPLAPAKGFVARFPAAMAGVMNRLGIDPRFVAAELNEMTEVSLAKTASRQVLGVMNEITFMANTRSAPAAQTRTTSLPNDLPPCLQAS